MIEERFVAPRSISFFTIVSIFVFFTIFLASSGLYFYKGLQNRKIGKMEDELVLAKDRFESAKIIQLQQLDKRLKASSEILSKHVAVSPIFKILQAITMKTVQYTEFNYQLSETDSKVHVIMRGLATGYRSIALQADLFAKNEYLIDPIFSNPSLDSRGNVIFDLDFYVDSSLVNYKQMLKNEEVVPAPAPVSTNPEEILNE